MTVATHDIDADKCNKYPLTRKVRGTYGYANNSDNELANRHARGTNQEERTSAKAFNAVQTG